MNRLRVILAEHNLHIKELAAASDLPYTTVTGIVGGRRPHPDNAYEIIDGLNQLIGRRKYRFDDVFPNYDNMRKKKRA